MSSELLLLIVAFAFGGAVLGVFWRWHVLWLLTLCALLGFAVCLVMHDWSHFNAMIADARGGGSAWVSWCVWFFVEFVLFAIPAALGGAIGFIVRKTRDVYVGDDAA